ncbi:MAG: hypothetical protein HQL56_15130 [Magnetococcales bacterium]|nr:hypothetical protein [Magnetococcales bacterium]
MSASPSLCYAQVRLQARHAERPGSAVWTRLGGIRSFTLLLKHLRESSLAYWVSTVSADYQAAEVEQRLAQQWRLQVRDLSVWVPGEWKKAVSWLEGAVELNRSPSGGPSLAEWGRHWQSLWPDGVDRAAREGLRRLTTLLKKHQAAFSGLSGPQAGWEAREDLQSRLTWLLRAETGRPAAVFAFLALIWLDWERVRGLLVERQLFDEAKGSA